MEWTFTIDTIREVASQFLGQLKSPRVIAFHGEMGAGKTTFINALCNSIGSGDPVSSPTFSIINEYLLYNNYEGKRIANKIYHIDLYRLKDETEAIRAGVEDVLYSGSWCFVEWPERAPGLFPPGTVHVRINAIDEHTRLLKTGDN